jgi:hypothetical protein
MASYNLASNICQALQGESIERALQRMRCPHELQAHQIQGLDYPAIFPVVQWQGFALVPFQARPEPFLSIKG